MAGGGVRSLPPKIMKNNRNKYSVFIDFDNTITTLNIFDDMLKRFSDDESWRQFEREWENGRIGSRECLSRQLECLKLTKDSLDKYLSTVKLDPYFKKLAEFLKSRNIPLIVLSDNFDYILKRILKNNHVRGLSIYANKLRFVKGKLTPSFPFADKDCRVCAHCKIKNLLANKAGDPIIIYIGDGQSDICPAKSADIVFAKSHLLSYFKEKKIDCYEFGSLKDVYNNFRDTLVLRERCNFHTK